VTDILNYTKSEEIFSAAQQLMPGGVSSPVRAFKSVGGQPIVFDRVKGPLLGILMEIDTLTTLEVGVRLYVDMPTLKLQLHYRKPLRKVPALELHAF